MYLIKKAGIKINDGDISQVICADDTILILDAKLVALFNQEYAKFEMKLVNINKTKTMKLVNKRFRTRNHWL